MSTQEPTMTDRPNADYAAAIRTNRAAALAWLNTSIGEMVRAFETDPEEIGIYPDVTTIPLRNGAELRMAVTFTAGGTR